MKILRSSVFVALSVVVALSVLAYGTVHQPTLAIFYMVVALMAVTWTAVGWARGEVAVSRHVFQIPLFAAAIYAVLQSLPIGHLAEIAGVSGIPRTLSLSPYDSWITALHLIALGLFLSLALAAIDRAARIEKLVNFLLIFGFAYAFYAILQSFLSPTRIYGVYERPSPFGSFVNRHNFAAYMEMMIGLPLGILLAGGLRPDRKLFYITTIGIMSIALLLSGSRGGLVSMIAAIGLALLLTNRAHGAKKRIIRIAVVAVMIGVIVIGALMIGTESSLNRVVETAQAGDISTDRTQIWNVTLHVIGANLPFGAGIGAFGEAYTPFDHFNGLARVEQAHNDYLQAVADAGLVGAVLLALFLYWFFVEARRNIKTENDARRGVAIGTTIAIFAVLVHSLFDFVLHTTAVTVLFMMMLALLVASGREQTDDRPNNDHRSRSRKRASVTPIRSEGRVRVGRS